MSAYVVEDETINRIVDYLYFQVAGSRTDELSMRKLALLGHDLRAAAQEPEAALRDACAELGTAMHLLTTSLVTGGGLVSSSVLGLARSRDCECVRSHRMERWCIMEPQRKPIWAMTQAELWQELDKYREQNTVPSTQLRVGDVVYSEVFGESYRGVFRIDKITPKQRRLRVTRFASDWELTNERLTLPAMHTVSTREHGFREYHKVPQEYIRVRDVRMAKQRYGETHAMQVRRALEMGKSVPLAVLQEYKTEKWAQKALKGGA